MRRFQRGIETQGDIQEPAGAISGFQSLGYEDPGLGIPLPRGIKKSEVGAYLMGGHLSLEQVDRGTEDRARISGAVNADRLSINSLRRQAGGEAAQA